VNVDSHIGVASIVKVIDGEMRKAIEIQKGDRRRRETASISNL